MTHARLTHRTRTGYVDSIRHQRTLYARYLDGDIRSLYHNLRFRHVSTRKLLAESAAIKDKQDRLFRRGQYAEPTGYATPDDELAAEYAALTPEDHFAIAVADDYMWVHRNLNS